MVLRRIWNYGFQIYETRLRPRIQTYWQRVKPYYDNIKPILLHAFVAFTVALFCLYISAFLFGVVYYYNMPTIYHSFDVHFQYDRPCVEMHRNYRRSSEFRSGRVLDRSCYPTAKIILDDPLKKVVDPGQPYRAYLTLEVPESPTNLGIGMFMVTMKYGETQTSYPTSLRYRPLVLQYGYMLAFWPLYLFDFWEAKQILTVPLFERVFFAHQTTVHDSLKHPKGKSNEVFMGERAYTRTKHAEKPKHAENLQRYAEIQIDYPDIEIYSAQLHLTATFSGLQYLLFQWPVFSFLIGTAIFFVPVLSCLLVLLYLAFVFGANGTATNAVRHESGATGSNTAGDAGYDDAGTPGGASNAGGDSEGPGSTASSTSSSIEMIGSPSVENITMDTELEDDDPPRKEGEYTGEASATSSDSGTLRRRQ